MEVVVVAAAAAARVRKVVYNATVHATANKINCFNVLLRRQENICSTLKHVSCYGIPKEELILL